jgi:hypothetical protein
MTLSKKIARTALLVSVNMILLLLGQLIRTNTLTFLALASFISALALILIDMRYSMLLYVATSVLAFIFIPDKTIGVAYLMFFGSYGIIKSFIERINNSYAEFTIKTIYFIAMSYIIYLIIGKNLIDLNALMQKYDIPVYIFLIMFALLFNVYDFIYSAVIKLIYKKFVIKREK